MVLSVSDLCERYRRYNQKFFGGRLPADMVITVVADNEKGQLLAGKKELGCFGPVAGHPTIEINEAALRYTSLGETTLLHEMVHASVGLGHKHGSKRFKDAIRALGIEALVEVLR